MRSAIIRVGNGTAFIDGIRSGHKCNFNGDPIYTSTSGKVIYWHTYRQWAHLPTSVRDELIQKHHIKIDDPINEMTTCCSICKSPFNPLWDIDI